MESPCSCAWPETESASAGASTSTSASRSERATTQTERSATTTATGDGDPLADLYDRVVGTTDLSPEEAAVALAAVQAAAMLLFVALYYRQEVAA